MRVTRLLAAASVLAVAPLHPAAAPAREVLRNWFDDPYFPVRSGIAACPVPLGPFASEADMKHETHYRSERGTRCWLAGQCTKPTSYHYDAGIAKDVRARFESSAKLRDASLWVTVQRRFVWIEGCVPPGYREGELEKMVRDIPDVERVIVFVSRNPRLPPAYRVAAPGQVLQEGPR